MTLVPFTSKPVLSLADRGSALEVAARIADAVAGTDFVPEHFRNNAAAVAAAILYGDELGLGPMQSLEKLFVVKGRIGIAAETQRALILAAGHDLWIEELTITKVTVAGKRSDSEQTSRVTWTLDDAKRARLDGQPAYRMYPRQMLLARASAELARTVFPDAIGGLAATEELEDTSAPVARDGDMPVTPAPKRTRRKRASVSAPATTLQSPSLPPEPPHVPVAGDEPSEATPPASEGAPELITDAQRKKLHALFRERGITDRQERLDYCTAVLGKTVPSSSALTKADASWLIEHFEGQPPSHGDDDSPF